jgi:hypothetical protein
VAAALSGAARACAASLWAGWWAEEARAEAALRAVLAAPAFAGALLVERQGALLKFRVPRGAAALADLFEAGEAVRQGLGKEGTTLTLGETSLEEIFNAMAATQEEERGQARGWQQ